MMNNEKSAISADSDRRKSPEGTFPPKHPSCAHSPMARTLAGREVFFASAELRQKTDFKSPLRGQIEVYRQTESAISADFFCFSY